MTVFYFFILFYTRFIVLVERLKIVTFLLHNPFVYKSTMYSLLILLFLSMIKSFVIVKIHRDSLYSPYSPCAFINNVSLSNDASIQSCIWECVHEFNCQTAMYYKNEKICSMFSELNNVGQLQPSGSIQASVICYQKNHSKIFRFQNFKRFAFLDPVSSCSSSSTTATTTTSSSSSTTTTTTTISTSTSTTTTTLCPFPSKTGLKAILKIIIVF